MQTVQLKWHAACATAGAGVLLLAGALPLPAHAGAAAAQATVATGRGSTPVERQLAAQAAELREVRRELARQKRMLDEQQRRIAGLQHALAVEQDDARALRASMAATAAAPRAGATPPGGQVAMQAAPAPAGTMPYAAASGAAGQPAVAAPRAGMAAAQPVGVAPPGSNRPPAVAPIFDQPGVLTPKGKFVIEPSYQFAYSSSNQVALIGYTIIPALVIGLVDIRQVRTTTQIAELTMRYGITNRLEAEVRVPYVAGHTDDVTRPVDVGSATNQVFTTTGKGLGDIEATLRYQFNNGGADRPYYVGWLRFKSRTGTDPFEVTTDCVQVCLANTTGTGLPLEMPTGSGFYSLQPGLTWLFPSDPVVFFGNFSYLHNFPRDNVSLTLVGGAKEPLGNVKVGDVFDASVGVGLALNDRASISFGYDQSLVGVTRANGQTLAGSTRTVLGSLLVGGSYRLTDTRTLNVVLGVGVTRDTPDVTLTARLPMTF